MLLGNDPGDRQWSVLDYGHQLHRALAEALGPAGRVSLVAPDTLRALGWLRGGRVGTAAAMYWSRGIVYPRLVRRCRADFYHILDHGNSELIRWLDPARTVVFCHDLIPLVLRGRSDSLWPRISRRAFGRALRAMTRAAAVLVNSACTRQDVITRLGYPADRLHVVPLGLDPALRPPADEQARASARAAFGLPPGPWLLHVGHAVFYKNLEGLLETLRLLARRGESAKLVRAGAFLSASHRRLIRRWGLADRVVELGPLPRERLRRLYHAADLFLYPSWYEGQGLPPLEAMACGVPVIVSDRGALPETVGDAGLVVPPAPAQLADAAQRLLHDPVRREALRARGFARAAQFRWDAAAQRTLDAYRSILTPAEGGR
ncbi:MAG: hypothetical protein A3C53_03225 [Omnitrophica WOR_2 bacterium RIFCSPHIGHO2_02_FULL_68_15]|nr:MAG: hypothetical protein A3C53_03225 [Omnitrophica WOR_2 bacterium RIFCSPHIGHO2_02_FULL_68_15]